MYKILSLPRVSSVSHTPREVMAPGASSVPSLPGVHALTLRLSPLYLALPLESHHSFNLHPCAPMPRVVTWPRPDQSAHSIPHD